MAGKSPEKMLKDLCSALNMRVEDVNPNVRRLALDFFTATNAGLVDIPSRRVGMLTFIREEKLFHRIQDFNDPQGAGFNFLRAVATSSGLTFGLGSAALEPLVERLIDLGKTLEKKKQK